ncbi:DUF2516 family protein [Embleya scabrispora]|uniref:DUF2516 family protein n=1 Tax=Embleya scabrispora TaxID=159449 RepID=UPI000477B1B6|nr:DUF2516 family protein [Embleya scabrispora]MYS79901.1 DUF2516 family protein [Streptomyces sp. SID5474]
MLTAKFDQVLTWLFLGILLLKVFCLFDAAFRREDAYRAADKKKKSFWLILLGVAVVVDVLPTGLGLMLMLAGLVAAIVYLVDVRPALKEVAGGRGGGRNMGPYGPR